MKTFKFKATEDMTVQELAEVMKVFIVSLIEAMQQKQPLGQDDLEIDDEIFEMLSPELQRFFEE